MAGTSGHNEISTITDIALRLSGDFIKRSANAISQQDETHRLQLRIPLRGPRITPREIISHIAEQNSFLRDSLFSSDGSVRPSLRALVNGEPLSSLDREYFVAERVDDDTRTSAVAPQRPVLRPKIEIRCHVYPNGTAVCYVITWT